MKDSTVDSLEVLDWVKQLYGEKVNPFITSVKICQDKTDVWVTITRQMDTHLGCLIRDEVVDLSIVVDSPVNPAYEDDIPHYTPQRDLCINAEDFFRDVNTLHMITSIFDK